MDVKQLAAKVFKKSMESNNSEAKSMRKIFSRMIKSELDWADAHKDENVCSKCGRVNF